MNTPLVAVVKIALETCAAAATAIYLARRGCSLTALREFTAGAFAGGERALVNESNRLLAESGEHAWVLHLAARSDGGVSHPGTDTGAGLLRELLASGCWGAVDSKDRAGFTPVHHASMAGQRETVAMLLDMGAEYHCYTSDITCSYPVSGTFTAEQRLVYETVLECQKQIMEAMRPGVSWPDMHRLMWRVTLERLVSFGVLQGDVDEMLDAELGAVFIPCGLGHLIGCDTHDVGGYLPGHPPRIGEPGIKALRTARILEEGMVLTVEPGLYFIDHTIEKALADERQSKFFVLDRLAEFRSFGGVRLEDVVAVTADGIVNYTLTPRTVEEVESVMAGGPWPPVRDDAKWLRRAWLTPLSGELGSVE